MAIPNDILYTFLRDGNESFKKVDEVSADDTIIGFIERISNGTSQVHNVSTASAVWRLVRLTKIGNVTTRTYPGGVDDYLYVWDNRNDGTYTYQ